MSMFSKPGIYSKLSLAAVLLLLLVAFIDLKQWRMRAIKTDGLLYYSYLPAWFIYQDNSFSFTDKLPEVYSDPTWQWNKPGPGRPPKMTIGVAIMQMPFFLVAHVYASAFTDAADGISPPYQAAVAIAAMVYMFLGLLVLRKILLKWFDDKAVALVLFCIAIGTNLVYYAANEPSMSHAYSFFLFAAFMWATVKWHENPAVKNAILPGIIFGFISLIRPTNGLIALFFIFYNVSDFSSLKEKPRLLRQHFSSLLVITFCTFLVLLPQLLYWKNTAGSYIYYSYGDERFFFNHPKIIKLLLSYRKGWLVYTPLMVFAIAGFFFIKRYKNAALGIILFTAINIYVLSSWWCWWYGGSFGQRSLVESYSLLALPLSAFTSYVLRKKWLRYVYLAVLAFFVFLNQFQIKQYQASLIHWDSMSREAYWKVFLSNKRPENYEQLLKPTDEKKAKMGLDDE